MALSYRGSLNGNQQPVMDSAIILNSTALTVGDPVNTNASGYADLAATGERIAGVVVGFRQASGELITATSGRPNAETFTSESDNESVDQVEVLYSCDPFAIYSIQADATLAVTTGSDLKGVYFDLNGATGASRVDESTVQGGGSSGGGGQVRSMGPDPDNETTHVLVNIRESEYIA